MVAPATYNRKADAQAQDAGDEWFLGVNNRLAPDRLAPGLLWDAENIRMRDGKASTRYGVTKPGWLNDTIGGGTEILPPGTFYGAGVFKDPNSFEWVLEAVGGDVFRHKANNTRVQLMLPTGVKLLSRCQFVQAFNRVFVFRGRYVQPLVMTDINTGFVDVVAKWAAATVYNAAVVATGQTAQEMAYGPFQAVTSVTSAGLTATVTTTAEHGYVTGADVTLSGATPSGYNGRFNITVVNSSTFTYKLATALTSPATGTITCSNMAYYWKALGSRVTLTSLTSAATTATATKNGHGFTTGQYVTLAGATQTEYNGTYQITVTGANTFTYVFAGSGTTPATGTITARTSVVLAAQSPDTNAEAWQQIYNVLPNATDALYINNQLLVPTAYTPGASSYDSTSSYTKTDYLVAMNYLDAVHFNFTNDFRINQGSDDEIVCLVKYAADTAIVFKTKSFAVIANITLDLSQLTVDMQIGYGATGTRAAVVAGKNVLFVSPKRGVCALLQNQLGQVRSVDIPFSNDIPEIVKKINWTAAAQIRVAWWDDKLFVSVPFNGSASNNAMLVYDFRVAATAQNEQSGQWCGADTGAAMCALEFFKATYAGLERLMFAGTDNFVSMVEDAEEGDQVASASTASKLTFTPISDKRVTRGYRFDAEGPKAFKAIQLVVETWNPTFSITRNTGAANTTGTVLASQTFSRTVYLRPFDKAAWVDTNANLDFATAGRGDYSVPLGAGGFYLDGNAAETFQEFVVRRTLPRLNGSFAQFTITNTTGRLNLKSITPTAMEGQRRAGIQI